MQRGVVDAAKPIIQEEIATKLDTKPPTKPFRVADFGCSTGHNSFPAMQLITEAIENKFQAETTQTPDFHVFFNDQVVNDSTLFSSHSHPKGSITLQECPVRFTAASCLRTLSTSLTALAHFNWLSQVPEEVADDASPAWNRGRVHYIGAKKEVFEAYSKRYANDIECFLEARAEELVSGRLMALLVPADPTLLDHATSFTTPTEIELLGSCLVDMANKVKKHNIYFIVKIKKPCSPVS